MPEHKIYLVLLRSDTILSKLIHLVKHDEYTHAALSLDRSLLYMFSFGRRHPRNPFLGCFRLESLHEGLYALHRELPGLILEISVSEEQYRLVKGHLENFLLDGHRYHYNYLGLVANLFHRSWQSETGFFCSEFVYHVLQQSGVCDFAKPRDQVRPQELLGVEGRVIFRGNLKDYPAAPYNQPRYLPKIKPTVS